VIFGAGFAKLQCKNVVFGWNQRGKCVVNRGELTRLFVVTKMRQLFKINLWKMRFAQNEGEHKAGV
jgi:hypothetical protein